MNRSTRTALLAGASAALTALAGPALADGPTSLVVNPKVGNSTMTAVYEAPLGERISAISSKVDCNIKVDGKGMVVSGSCKVPLETVMVDNNETKSEHFRDWATNKKVDPKNCFMEAKFTGLKFSGALEPEKPVTFEGDVPFTVCGRGREDKKMEHLKGTAVMLPKDNPKDPSAVRIRAHMDELDREQYHIGPAFTDGWLAKVQNLAKVVAKTGTVDLNLMAEEKK